MKLDIYSLCIAVLFALIALVVAWPRIRSYWTKVKHKKKPTDDTNLLEIQSQEETFPMARATNDKEVLNYTPKEEELEHTQECVASSEDQFVFALDEESDYTVFLLKNVPKQKLHDAILGLMKSRMEITNLKGEKISMEQILSESGQAEEPIKNDDKKNRVIDPEPQGQKSAVFDSAIKQLSSNKRKKSSKPRKKSKNG